MSTLNKTFNPAEVEQAQYQEWENSGAFYADPSSPKKPYTIMIPPPNVTGSLHIGHAFTNVMQDILIRYHRMKGYDTLWQPGTDHASIAVHMVLENQLAQEGKTRQDLGREAFMEKAWEWKEHSGGTIMSQLRALGATADWSRERFTMDEGLSRAVTKLFVKWYNEKLIYKSKRLVNWDPKRQTVISDIEVIQKETKGHMWHIQYAVEGAEAQTITVATTRPETMFGDVAVAVNPKDPRYKKLIGKFAVLPIVGRLIPIIGDEHADPEQGSGAVKITPAHDFNDFEVAKRHNLEMISVFDETACLNSNTPSAYRGLPRYEARKKVLQELEELEAIEKVEDHMNVAPYGERSDEVIEPYLTEQWYVDAETLAKPALEAVRSGKIEFVPKQWENTYFHWLENIQPWCISRQLWWGHQIPAWYGPDGELYVAESEEEAQAQAGEGVKLTRDPDVLDTWFSSQLWPFSTLGWPDQTDELKKYYPTDVLVTGFDIIFFWVARMVMAGINVMGDVPFRKVYMHGLVRDAQGQKMSKSKGNVINPLDITEKYGADALRFTLTALAATGRDIKLAESRIEGYRNFGTKLWNASRYCEMQDALPKAGFNPATVKSPLNKWIIGALMDTIEQLDQAFEALRFNDIANTMYQFVWNNFCDWYLEFTKPIMYGKEGDQALQDETRATTGFVLQQIITMLNPVMPYITEELNKAFQGEGRKLLLLQPWPSFDKKLYDKEAMAEIDWLCRLITEIRSVRSDMNVPASQNVRLIVNNASDTTKQRLIRYKANLAMMAKIGDIETDIQNPPKGSIQSIVDEATIMLPIAELIDLDKERDRLKKQIGKLEQELKGIRQRLDNKQFVANAPDDVVAEQKVKAEELETTLGKYSSALKQLEVA
ncbi:MAG: valine--tRNA ligase [Micavibrio sp.]|nr:valine--tRNA ligase [Micavibrio sp.]